jgi:cardiolipin synthase
MTGILETGRDLARRRPRLLAVIAALSLAAASLGVGLARWPQPDEDAFQLPLEMPASGPAFASALYQSVGVHLVPGNAVALLDNGAVFDALVEEIGRARSSVHVLLYIWEKGAASDRITAALVERARAGVACRILVDDFGSLDFAKTVQPPLVQAGCEVRLFRPLPGKDKLSRNHRKIVVIDGKTAFTGGFGIRDNWLGDGVHEEGWRDANVRFTGPAVADAQQAIAENWQEAGGALFPPAAFPELTAAGPAAAAFVSSTASPNVTRSERLTQLMIAAARKRIWIANAYFVPSRAILDLLARKASSGVDVRILAPGKKSDSKTSFGAQQGEYGALMRRGVRVWEYQPSMMHAKTMVVDDELSLLGSINLDPLSLNKLEEGALVVEDRALAAALALTFGRDCEQSKERSR